MMTISSPAGRRLARAKAAIDEGPMGLEGIDAWVEFEEAATAVADELIADRHHESEGD